MERSASRQTVPGLVFTRRKKMEVINASSCPPQQTNYDSSRQHYATNAALTPPRGEKTVKTLKDNLEDVGAEKRMKSLQPFSKSFSELPLLIFMSNRNSQVPKTTDCSLTLTQSIHSFTFLILWIYMKP